MSAQDAGEEKLRPVLALEETFQSNQRDWTAGQGGNWDAAIGAGVMTWHHKVPEGFAFSVIDVPLAGRRPYEVSLEVRHREGSQGKGAGLLWGMGSDAKASNALLLAADGTFVLVRRENGENREVASGRATWVRPFQFVRLTLRIFGPRAVAFVNGVVVWTGETPPSAGPWLGVATQGGAVVEFDNLLVRHLRAEDTVYAERLAAYDAARGQAERVFIVPPAAVPVQTHVASTVSAATLAAWEKQAFPLHQAYKYNEAAALYRQIVAQQPEHINAHVGLAWCLLNLGQAEAARQHADIAVAMDPLGLAARSVALYTTAAAGDEAAAAEHLRYVAFFDHTGAERAAYNKDFDDLARHGWGDMVTEWRPRLLAAFGTQPGFTPIAGALNRCFDAASRGALVEVAVAANEALTATAALGAEWRPLEAWVANLAGGLISDAGNPRAALPLLERAYSAFQRTDVPASRYLRGNNAVLLANAALVMSDPERAVALLEGERARVLALSAYAGRMKAELLLTLCRAAATLGREEDLRRYAGQLHAVTGTGRDAYYQASAQLHRAGSYASTRIPTEAQEMKAAYERALAIATQHHLDDLATSATDGLALAYWKTGDKERARETYRAGAEREEQRKDFAHAEVLLNNLGALLLQDKNYPEAAQVFRQAVALTERARAALGPEERIGFLATRLSAYQFLIEALHQAGNASDLFDAQNALRARSLAETLALDAPAPTPTLASFQAGLAPDEAAVFFTVVGPAEIVVQVVTKDDARSVLADGRAEVVALKAKYLDRFSAGRPGYKPLRETVWSGGQEFNAGDPLRQVTMGDFDLAVEVYREAMDLGKKVPADLRTELLAAFGAGMGRVLLDPVVPLLAGKRKVVLFPDGILNFVPFEALPAGGRRYLVEQFDVRYVQSASVWQALRQRNYAGGPRRSFLGMGGARYAAMSEQAEPLDNATRQVQLQIAAQRNVQAGASQREVYAALFGSKPMTYLAGSLAEVQALGGMFQDAAVFTGLDMSENRIKAMARDGSLAQFRIVHLATHGFAIDSVPQLSGIAMSILPIAEGGEDGYLTAPEIARLGMKADLAVLSACQTALGRIYGGEGVSGLTGALLLGGANRALVSLWPVSDAGTMYFMRDVHALVLKEGVSYDVAANQVKRRFIAGDYGTEFQDPFIWAPFVHYGL